MFLCKLLTMSPAWIETRNSKIETRKSKSPITNHHSQFTIHNSQFTNRRSPIANLAGARKKKIFLGGAKPEFVRKHMLLNISNLHVFLCSGAEK
jgi:hypothetical protein